MKATLSLGLLALVFAISTAEVQEITDANFEDIVKSKPFVLIEFYSPKCPYCQALAPRYEIAEQHLASTRTSVRVAKVDCTNDAAKVSCDKVRYVPWIVLYHDGKLFMKYGNRSRDAVGLVDFVTEGIKSQDKAPLLDFSVPKVQPEATCDQSPPPVNKTLPTAAPIVAPTPTPDPPSPVNSLTDDNFDTFIKTYPYVIVDYYTPWCSDCKHLKPLYDEAAAKLASTTPSIRFAKVDCNQGNTATALTCHNSNLKFYPWVVLFHDGRPESILNQENVPDVNAIYNFINKDTNIIGGVMELDDTNFDKTVAGFPLAVVNFYAPWCFYCKKMAPVYEELAKDEQEAHPDVRLIKVDCSSTNPKTKIICSRNDISFLPTLKVFEHGRFMKEYEGDKTKKEGLSGFISDVLTQQQQEQSIRRSMKDSKKKNENDDKKKQDDKKKKSSKDKESKKDDKKSAKKKHKKMDAAKILKKVFTQFDKKNHGKKTAKHNDDDDDDYDDDDYDDRKRSSWQQVAKDIHHIAKDMHKLTKQFRKSLAKQPAVDRLVKALKRAFKGKESDEDK